MASDTQRDKTYTAQQIAVAARDLRDAAGADEEAFSLEQAINMLSDEIRLLRERGFDDQRVAGLLNSFEIEATPADVGRYYRNNDSMD